MTGKLSEQSINTLAEWAGRKGKRNPKLTIFINRDKKKGNDPDFVAYLVDDGDDDAESANEAA